MFWVGIRVLIDINGSSGKYKLPFRMEYVRKQPRMESQAFVFVQIAEVRNQQYACFENNLCLLGFWTLSGHVFSSVCL